MLCDNLDLLWGGAILQGLHDPVRPAGHDNALFEYLLWLSS